MNPTLEWHEEERWSQAAGSLIAKVSTITVQGRKKDKIDDRLERVSLPSCVDEAGMADLTCSCSSRSGRAYTVL